MGIQFELLHPADQIVMIMERIYDYGMTTTSGGNLSIMDENGDMWITPGSVDKGSLTRRDIVCVKPNGEIVGIHKPSSEFPFHMTIYNKRSDIKAILHAHPPALVSFSIVRKIPDTRLIPNADLVCGTVRMAAYGLPGSTDLGEKIAAEFARGVKSVMLENHGIVVGDESLFQAFMAFETLDFCARLEINANRIGKTNSLSEHNVALSRSKRDIEIERFIPENFSSKERDARREMCDLIHRAYDQKLFTSTQGTFSSRLDNNAFIITPYMIDRKYIGVEDIVRVENTMAEAGKTPSRSVMLHKQIYDKHPAINSVIISHPHYIMAFAVTDEVFDSRTIPESYIMLRDIPKLPFGSDFMAPELVADTFSKERSLLLIQNDCVIVTGENLLQAYDRLEVAEFSAKALIYARSLGEIVMINPQQVREIEEAFKL